MRRITCIVFAALLLASAGCTPRAVRRDNTLVLQADSLFSAGDFPNAAARFAQARDSLAGTSEGARAQFSLAFLNVFYGNPKVAWNRALREFKVFFDEYTEHPLVDRAKSWIRALVTMDALRQRDRSNTTKLKEIIAKQSSVKRLLESAGYDILLESVQRCYDESDSLGAKVRLLEEVIETIEKTQ